MAPKVDLHSKLNYLENDLTSHIQDHQVVTSTTFTEAIFIIYRCPHELLRHIHTFGTPCKNKKCLIPSFALQNKSWRFVENLAAIGIFKKQVLLWYKSLQVNNFLYSSTCTTWKTSGIRRQLPTSDKIILCHKNRISSLAVLVPSVAYLSLSERDD